MSEDKKNTFKGSDPLDSHCSPTHKKLPYVAPQITQEEQFEIYSMNCAFGGGCTTQSIPDSGL